MKKKSRYRWALLLTGRPFMLLLLLTIILVCACSQKKTPYKQSKTGGVLYFGIEVPFHGFDVVETQALNPPTAPLNNLIQEPLFRKDRSGNLIPVLGLSAMPSADATNWDIQLRKGVVFHDDTPFNADAVVHHWTRVLDPKKFRGRRILKPIRSVEKVDDHAVRFHLEHPWPPFLNVISNELLLFAFIPSPKAVAAGTHDREPVGTGPFKFGRWGAGDHFVVVKNEQYWQSGKPWLNKVVFRTIPDPQTRYASLESGEIDVISIDRGHLIRKAEQNPEFSVYPSQINGAEIILMNTTGPPLDDLRVRRALALANDQRLHVKMVYGDTVPLVHHPFGDLYPCSDVDYPEYDPEKAKQLIADYGKPVEIEILHSNTSRGRSIGELQQQLYKKIGVQVKPVGLSPVPHMAKVVQKDYQLATWRIPASGDYGPKFYAMFHSQSPGNFTGYADPEMDRLLEMQRVETDPKKREALLCRLATKINRDVPILYRGGRRYHVITRRKIRDMMDSPGFNIDLASAWVDEKVKFNPMAYEIEQKAVETAAAAFDCPDPGDVDTVKAAILGAWKGKDTWGATITMNFKADDTVDLHRTGGSGRTVAYTICSPKVYFRGRANVVVTPVHGRLEGHWKLGEYEEDILLERVE